jgi:hypothetical protein
MGQVAARPERDAAMLRAWIDGDSQSVIGARYEVSQQAVSQAIGRALDHLPDQDKAAEIRRTLELVDDLVAVYVPRARAGNMAASREVRGLLALRGRFLGVDRREVEHTGTVEHAHTWQPGPTTEQLLERWRQEGKLTVRGELTRTDQGPGS